MTSNAASILRNYKALCDIDRNAAEIFLQAATQKMAEPLQAMIDHCSLLDLPLLVALLATCSAAIRGVLPPDGQELSDKIKSSLTPIMLDRAALHGGVSEQKGEQ